MARLVCSARHGKNKQRRCYFLGQHDLCTNPRVRQFATQRRPLVKPGTAKLLTACKEYTACTNRLLDRWDAGIKKTRDGYPG